jgi:hypothetical protein
VIQLAAVELALSVGCATIFASAGVFKLVGSEPLHYRALGVVELVVAAALILEPTRTIALAVAVLLAVGFVGYSAVTAERPCRCFGERFKATSRKARTGRSLGVFVLALVALLARLVAGDPSTAARWHLTASVIGIVVGMLVVVLPTFVSPESDGKVAAW